MAVSSSLPWMEQAYCNSWDEWVGVDRLIKYNEENVRRQKLQNEMQKQKAPKPGGRPLLGKQKGSRRRKQKSDLLDKDKGTLALDKSASLQIPSKLKKQLIDDCEFITNLGKLVKLPRNPCVDDILSKYCAYRLKKDGTMAESVEEILRGLRSYFDKALPVMLLYKSERQQYDSVIKEGISPSTVYGAEHLLRLFVKLPELLAFANIDEDTHMELQQKLVHLLKYEMILCRFLQKNQTAFFLSAYHSMEGAEASTNNQETS
ncbi:unnamed protein product [Linum tenue]|uniref:MRG domain-containing protein n=1 Tax=Linum tenue TaxID=586396 RepID=A0AAV0P359_9ROSI|nr:unnamed protein product [Linum tenue]